MATTCGGYCSATNVLWLRKSSASRICEGGRTHLSMARRHANLVNFFDAGFLSLQSSSPRNLFGHGPLSPFPTLITYGNGIQEVKLKQMSSTISRSTANSLCLSCSITYVLTVNNKLCLKLGLFTYRWIHVNFPDD